MPRCEGTNAAEQTATARMDFTPDASSAESGQRSFTVSVVIPAFTLKRWAHTTRAVDSMRSQTVPVDRIILCIDNNEDLFHRAQAEWQGVGGVPVEVIPNRHTDHLAGQTAHLKAHGESRRFGAGSARNTAAELVTSDIIVFMDDDAWAEPNCVAQLLALYERDSVEAVGGAPVPAFETQRPPWFPSSFEWVYGCAYSGLPVSPSPQARLIGAIMSVRRSALTAVGGFHVYEFDDLDLCMRLAARFGPDAVYYAPDAVVHHHVPQQRVTWRYFWRRCYFVNREKVHAFQQMGSAANLHAERSFVWRVVRTDTWPAIRRGLSGDIAALQSVGAMLVGIMLAGVGHLVGRFRSSLARAMS